MRRVAEIMYIVESEREEFLKGALNMDEETQKFLWLCGVRKQQYFELNEYIFMTFEYKGDTFEEDMAKMAAYLDSKGHLIKKRRKDVPLDERKSTNWWAPIKRLGALLESKPEALDKEDEAWQNDYMSNLDGGMNYSSDMNDITYDEDDWTSSIHIFNN